MDAGEDRAHAQAGPGQQPGSSSIGPDRDGARSLEAFAIQHGLLFNYAWLMSLDPRDGGQQHETYVDLNFILDAEGIHPIDLHLSRLPWGDNPMNPSRTASS